MVSPPRAAVAGAGFIGPVHVEALRRAGVHVTGILGSSPEKSKAAAESLHLDRGYETFEELLGDTSVDVVHLATPNRFHFEQAKEALNAGKHVVCEKPLAMNSVESSELVALAEGSGLFACVAHNIRFYPLCIEAAARIRNGEIGEILHIHGSYVQDWLLHDTDFNWRVLAEDGGALRAVADIGTHFLDLVQWGSGHLVESVCADLQTVHPVRRRPTGGVETFSSGDPSKDSAASGSLVPVDIHTEDAAAVLLRFRGGAHGSMQVSQTTAGRKNCLRFEIAGTKASLAWNSETPNTMWIGRRGEANQELIRDPSQLTPEAAERSAYPGGHNEGFPDTFKQLFRTFYGCISSGKDVSADTGSSVPYPTFLDGHRELLLCEAILKSHNERRWENVASDTSP